MKKVHIVLSLFIVLTAISCSVTPDIEPVQEVTRSLSTDHEIFTALNVYLKTGDESNDLSGLKVDFYKDNMLLKSIVSYKEQYNRFNVFWRKPGLGSWTIVVKDSKNGKIYEGIVNAELIPDDPYRTIIIYLTVK